MWSDTLINFFISYTFMSRNVYVVTINYILTIIRRISCMNGKSGKCKW